MIRLALVALIALVAAIGCDKPAAKPKTGNAPPLPPGSGVHISDAGISFDGKQLALPATTAQLTEILGQPDRTLDKANKILIWDQRGIYAYCKKDRDEIHDISFAFQKQDFDFAPSTNYTGTIAVAGTPVSPATTDAELKQAGFTLDLGTYEKSVGNRAVLIEYDGKALGLSYSLP